MTTEDAWVNARTPEGRMWQQLADWDRAARGPWQPSVIYLPVRLLHRLMYPSATPHKLKRKRVSERRRRAQEAKPRASRPSSDSEG